MRASTRSILRVLLILITGATAYLLFWPVPIDPVVFHPPPNPGLSGPFARNETLRAAAHLPPLGPAPEDVTKGPDGSFYTGLQDGRIVRFVEDGRQSETFVQTHGRPLGMQFDATGNLIVADAFRGLLSVSPDRRITVLTDSAAGKRLLFPDDLDIAADGTIWFSDASQRFDQHNWMLDFLETRATGRLLSYDPGTGRTTVRLDGLLFANGVAIGPGDEYVLVNETIASLITRLWLRGPRAGQRETLLTLPGYPDNLSHNGRGVFWVALPVPRVPALEWLWPSPFLRKLVMRLPGVVSSLGKRPPHSWVIAIDASGKVIRNLQDSSGASGGITSVNEIDGKLYFGSITTSFVSRYELP